MNAYQKLLSPLDTTIFTFDNRIVMAPMNRRRAEHGVPSPSSIIYYQQRADAGLIITDNTAIAPNGIGYLNTPGIYTDEQKTAWAKIASAVHAKGGKIFMQLVHGGRIGHQLNNDDGSALVAPSAVPAQEVVKVKDGRHLPVSKPEALSSKGVQDLITKHIEAAKSAVNAGFDGVEIHGAHGYLVEQFLHPHTNQRTDEYGGSVENRSRFLLEIVEGVIKAIGANRTGIRLSPYLKISDLLPYEEELATHEYLTKELDKLGILYIHLSNRVVNGSPVIPDSYIRSVRNNFQNLLILAGGYTPATAEAALKAGLADMVAFGTPYIANPDLVDRIRNGHPLSSGKAELYYDGGDAGYIDYPRYGE